MGSRDDVTVVTDVGVLRAPESAAGASVGTWTGDVAGAEFGRTSVAEVPQAKIPITIPAKGKASSRDIPDYPQPSKWTDKKLADDRVPHRGALGLKLRLFVPKVRILIRKRRRPRISLVRRVNFLVFSPGGIQQNPVLGMVYSAIAVGALEQAVSGPDLLKTPGSA